MKDLNKYFDHTLLKQDATTLDIITLCQEAKNYDFYAVCVNSCYVSLSSTELKNCDVKVAAVISFPLGAMASISKCFEADMACENGADEIDMVINVGAMKEGNYDYVQNEISAIASIVHEHDAILKVIIETHQLNNNQISKACQFVVDSNADFIKTSTGFTGGGATIEDIKFIKQCLAGKKRIKASGGIKNLATAQSMINAGADRIGASASVDIMNEYMIFK